MNNRNYIHICLPELLPHKSKSDFSSTKGEARNKTKQDADLAKLHRRNKDYLTELLKHVDTQSLPQGEHYYLICVNVYVGPAMYCYDCDNYDYSKVMNQIVKTLRFIPDDSPEYLSVIITGVINGQHNNEWLFKHLTESRTSHSEIFFIPKSMIAEVFTGD